MQGIEYQRIQNKHMRNVVSLLITKIIIFTFTNFTKFSKMLYLNKMLQVMYDLYDYNPLLMLQKKKDLVKTLRFISITLGNTPGKHWMLILLILLPEISLLYEIRGVYDYTI